MSPSAGPPSDTPSPPTAAGSPRTSTSVTSDPGSSKGEDVTKQPSQTAARRGTSNTATGHQAKPYLRESQPQEGGGLDGCRRGVSLQGQHGAQQADLPVSTRSGVLTGGNIWPVQTQDSGLDSGGEPKELDTWSLNQVNKTVLLQPQLIFIFRSWKPTPGHWRDLQIK